LPYFFLKLKKPWEMMINPWPSELGADSWVRQFPRSWWPPVMFLEKAMTRVRRGRNFFSSVPWSSWSNFMGIRIVGFNGYLTVCRGKSPFLIGKPFISMGHFPWLC
jgi:hypothetical protein